MIESAANLNDSHLEGSEGVLEEEFLAVEGAAGGVGIGSDEFEILEFAEYLAFAGWFEVG